MGLIKSLLKAVGIEAKRPLSGFSIPGMPAMSSWDYEACAREGYEGNPYVYRSIALVATCASAIPVYLNRQTRSGLVDISDSDHALNTILESPNPTQGRDEFIDELLRYYLIGGMAYALGIGIGKDGTGPPVELWNMVPSAMQVLASDRIGPPHGFRRTFKGGFRDYVGDEARQVFWFRAFDARSRWQGTPGLMAARHAVNANTSALRYNDAVLRNGGIVGTHLHSKTKVPDETAEAYIRQFEAEFMGPANAGRTHFTSGDIEVDRIGVTPQEMSFDSLIESTSGQISIVHGVPPQLVGARGQMTYSNYKEARQALYTDAVFPIASSFWRAFSRWVSVLYSGGPYVVMPDYDAVDVMKEARLATWDRVNAMSILRVDEKRAAIGYEPVGGVAGKAILMPPNLVPLEMVAGATGKVDE